jgi:RNA polymerase sigma factor (sigma-70 family)
MPHAARNRTQLIEANLGLASAVARRFVSRGESLEDLTQVGYVALIHAVDRFDPRRCVPLEAYAAATIRGEIQRHVRDAAAPVRAPRPSRGGPHVLVSAVPLAPEAADAGDPIAAAEARTDLRAALARLYERERRALALRYLADLPRAQVAARLGLSEAQTSRILARAKRQLADSLGEPPRQRERRELADGAARA